MKRHVKTLLVGRQPRVGGCGECQASCQSACKTSCTVGNQGCKQSR
ncbi:six-cysteine ranthipeptide SCIFF [Desulfothermobacter acidiphilus]